MPHPTYCIGLDFGTSSVRSLVARVADGAEVGLAVAPFQHGSDGVLSDPRDPNLARQDPADYQIALESAVIESVRAATRDPNFDVARVVGIGVDATASTPIPVDTSMTPLSQHPEFEGNLHTHAWLWKDHTAYAEARAITELAQERHPEYLAKCGGTYSSEWFFAKLLHFARVAPEAFAATAAWVEQGDYIVAFLSGCDNPREIRRNVCAAGHKALYNENWGNPTADFLDQLDASVGAWCRSHPLGATSTAGQEGGTLCDQWAKRTGLRAGIPISVAAIDAHVGAVGAGIRPGTLVKILGTSGCDMAVHPADRSLADIPGLCGVVRDSILPDHFGLEAGQAALGDLFGWFVRRFTREAGKSHAELTELAGRLKPGESGLLALDWNNGNRTVLADPLLTGCLVGQTLQTRPEEVYRALLESTAFGARVIMQRFEDYNVRVDQVVVCGGIAEKNPLLLQIFADVTGRPIRVSRSQETCALGAAIFGSVAAGADRGGHATVLEAQDAMCGLKEIEYQPHAGHKTVYQELYELYKLLHDAFGVVGCQRELFPVMKRLIALRERARGSA